MLKNFFGGVCAGILISIGGCVYLACDDRYIGALFFSVALLCICWKGYVLFTGRVGYMALSHTAEDWKSLFLGLAGNLLTTALLGLVIRYALPGLAEKAAVLCDGKLVQTAGQTLIRAAFCGVLMYLAVSIYKENKTPLGIVFCIPVFILSGFEHSIADMFYFGAGRLDGPSLLFVLEVIVGNSVGGLLLPMLAKIGGKKA
ncbi:MAG: formate/nitrite transporter family protein [Eubacteriales bacterium]|nr:formate/nitrite transporter family protein [Eubacteriales bacterium]